MRSIGVMVVGHLGNTGSTLLCSIGLLQNGTLIGMEIPSSLPPRLRENFEYGRLVCGGWDFDTADFLTVVSRKELVPKALLETLDAATFDIRSYAPVVTGLDFDPNATTAAAYSSAASAVTALVDDIEHFRKASQCERVIVIYLGSPSRRASPPLTDVADWGELLRRPLDSMPSSSLYAAAAVTSESDFIDFTPSEALLCPAILARSEVAGVQLVGRDGSTGQTMLKAAVGSMLATRGLRLKSWYSSNHLGNHDGLVLADADFAWLKMADKKRGLAEITGRSDFDHVVSIDYVPSKGDRKESFDSVVAEDMFGGEVRLRLNWEGWDSALATPLLLDLITLVSLGQEAQLSGLQTQLGYFFKAPVGAACRSPEEAWGSLVTFYDRLIDNR